MQLNDRFVPEVQQYMRDKAGANETVGPVLDDASIIWYGTSAFMDVYEAELVRDLMVLVHPDRYRKLCDTYGSHFLIDDHQHVPPMFVRFNPFEWLEKDFRKRPAIAHWLYSHAIVLQDSSGYFAEVCTQEAVRFEASIPSLLKRKYLEMRSERHGLRSTFSQRNELGYALVQTTVCKLAAEVVYLAEGKPYPWKKWLFWALEKETVHGKQLLSIAKKFWTAADPRLVISASDELISFINSVLIQSGRIPRDVVERWWLYVD